MVEAMRALTTELPLNDFGLPVGIYRSDLLPFHLYDTHSSHNHHTHSSKDPLLEDPISEDSQPTAPIPSTLTDLDPPSSSPPSHVGKGSIEDIEADAYSLLSGKGDGLREEIAPCPLSPSPRHSLAAPAPSEYRIAGFPAQSIQVAFMPLQYDEGFPNFETGRAFWDKLCYEPNDAYMVFERYLLMSFGTAGDKEEDDPGSAAGGIRSLSTLVLQLAPSIDDKALSIMVDKFKTYYHLYYWGLRTRSYDLFKVTQHRQQQELRAIETQDDHYVQSRQLRARLTRYMADEEDFWDLMTPKVAIDMHKHLTSLERVSAGVLAGGPNDGRSFEMAFRTIAQVQFGESTKDGTLLDEDGTVLERALEDPVTTKLLQELIIRGN